MTVIILHNCTKLHFAEKLSAFLFTSNNEVMLCIARYCYITSVRPSTASIVTMCCVYHKLSGISPINITKFHREPSVGTLNMWGRKICVENCHLSRKHYEKGPIVGIRNIHSQDSSFPWWNFCSPDHLFPGHYFVRGNECSREHSFPGPFVPWNIRSEEESALEHSFPGPVDTWKFLIFIP